ncbi:MAG TPA: PfkB family carbohydrate kinase [Clostridia bacterium]
MLDVTALGELLIDFTPSGFSKEGNALFEKNPGGAPANVLACISRLGGTAAFIGKVGDDIFGHFLEEVLRKHGIETRGLKFSKEAKTTLAFVELDNKGDRSFSFYRNPGADTLLEPSDIDVELIKSSKIFHFGSLSLTDEPSKSATLAAIKTARESGCILSYDPNLRPALWKSQNDAKENISSLLGYADILKVSEEELEFLTGGNGLDKGSLKLCKSYGIKIILVTRGPEGCYYRFEDVTGESPAFRDVNTVDTTGAGDAFLGGFLHSFLYGGGKFEGLTKDSLAGMVEFANAAASLSTSKKGAIPAMPGLSDVHELLSK